MKEQLCLLARRDDDVEEQLLGSVENGIYSIEGLLGDDDHRWKILAWIDEHLRDGFLVLAVKK